MVEDRRNLAIERGKRVKTAVKQRKLTQVELSKQANLSISAVRKICSGFRMLQLDQAYKFAEILQTGVDYLLCAEGIPPEGIKEDL